MIKAIIFDFYGTLVNEFKGYQYFFDKYLKGFVTTTSGNFIEKWFSEQRKIILNQNYRPFRKILEESLRNIIKSYDQDASFKNDFNLIFQHIYPYPGAMEILKNLKSRFILGILTNIDNNYLQITLNHLDFKFDIILTGEKLRSYKPNKANYECIINSLKLLREEVMFVSSSAWDVKAAKESGLTTVFVDRKGEGITKWKTKPNFVIADLKEMVTTL